MQDKALEVLCPYNAIVLFAIEKMREGGGVIFPPALQELRDQHETLRD